MASWFYYGMIRASSMGFVLDLGEHHPWLSHPEPVAGEGQGVYGAGEQAGLCLLIGTYKSQACRCAAVDYRKASTCPGGGILFPRERATISFGLLGPGRRVTATATLAGRANLEIRCAGARVALRTMPAGKAKVVIDRRNLGPAECTATLTSTSRSRRAYTLVVRLAVSRT